MIQCKICKREFKNIVFHLKHVHNLTVTEYKKQFGEDTPIVSPEASIDTVMAKVDSAFPETEITKHYSPVEKKVYVVISDEVEKAYPGEAQSLLQELKYTDLDSFRLRKLQAVQRQDKEFQWKEHKEDGDMIDRLQGVTFKFKNGMIAKLPLLKLTKKEAMREMPVSRAERAWLLNVVEEYLKARQLTKQA